MKSLILAAITNAKDAVKDFEEHVELGFSRNKSEFETNLKSRGIDLEKHISNHPKIDSKEEVAAAQGVQGEVELYTKEELNLPQNN